ncbi:Pumilio y domain family member 6 [Hypsizygus marmoreus]|uniref:Pumilio y domain family member 6 n=1 Tax=Hypsizygus marmoreus TaxID=39966 RepID=A0A369K7Y2_HYPMA|nr:Pumilio y domain family member 6 [Hypsizygus marmoreus]
MAAANRSTKKRPAASQAGPKPKKVQLEKPGKADKKRSRPVTAPVVADASASDSEGDLEEEGEDNDELVDEDEAGDQPMEEDVAGAPSQPKDPNAARESHKAQRLLQDQRRAAKPHSSLLVDAKRVWSLVRQKTIPSAERQKYVQDLMNVIRGRVKDIVFKHDASRIVQSVVKYGGQKERDEIAVELKGKYKELAQNKYSKFLVTKLIRLCPTHRASILLEFQTHVLRLLLHREATSVLADAFELYANAYERTILLRDFYGKETMLFSITGGSEAEKERAKKGLAGVLEGADVERRRRVLGSLKENLVSVFNNPDKGAVTHAIVHRALWEYISALNDVPDEAERDKLRREIFETCQDVLAEMVHTRDGSRVVREFLALGSAKDRKQILKVLKPHVERMCLDDEAQLVLFTALDVIDDTKLVSKSLVAEMTGPATKLYVSPQGRRSLFYLLVPRTRRHFTPAQIASLAETDETRARTSKKASEVREEEIRKFASDALVSWVEENAASVVREPGGSLVVAEIMLFADGDKTAASRSLLHAISIPYPSTDAARPHPIDLPHTSRLYKTLLQGGHFNHTSKSVERAPGWDAGAFAETFVEVVGEDVTVGMCTRGEANGAFVVAELCEAIMRETGREGARRTIKGWFGEDVRKKVEDGEAKGKKVLLEKIALL